MSPTQTPPTSPEKLVEQFTAAGFQLTREGDRLRIQQGACAAVVEQRADGLHFVEGPGYVIGQFIASLEDRGFQKFLVTAKARVPALAEHLKQIHEFSRQLSAAMDLPLLYNQSLGTVSDRYAYDRLRGR